MVYKIYNCMFRVLVGSLSFILLFQFCDLHSQETSDVSYLEIRDDAEEKYGPSTNLLNGVKYHYPYRSARGNPFFEVQGEQDASIQINGRLYEKQKIKYDIYNQFIVLDFLNSSGAPGSIVLSNEWLDYLVIGGCQFKKFSDENGSERFGQVIFEGNFGCVYFWEKEYSPNLHDGERHYQFSDPIRHPCIVIQEQFYPYSGKRSFLKCFPEQNQLQIKSYLKEKRIRIRKSTDLEMQSLMGYINQLSEHED